MTSNNDIINACTRLIIDGSTIGTGFLIDNRRLVTAAHVVKGAENITAEFSDATTACSIEEIDIEADFAILKTSERVDDITPLGYGRDVTAGDRCLLYGFPNFLQGSGALFEARIEGTTFSRTRNREPSILISSPNGMGARDIVGLSGAPVVVGNSVVGVIHQMHLGQSRMAGFFAAFPLSEILERLPLEIIKHVRPAPIRAPTTNQRSAPILVVSALDDELDYLFNASLEWSDPQIQEDGMVFRTGKLDPNIEIVATSAQGMGLTATAILTAKALKEWRPQMAVMIGTCGGRKEKGLALGDIVVAEKSFHYQYGAFKDGAVSTPNCNSDAWTTGCPGPHSRGQLHQNQPGPRLPNDLASAMSA